MSVCVYVTGVLYQWWQDVCCYSTGLDKRAAAVTVKAHHIQLFRLPLPPAPDRGAHAMQESSQDECEDDRSDQLRLLRN